MNFRLLLIFLCVTLSCGLFNSDSELEKYHPNRFKSVPNDAPFKIVLGMKEIRSGNVTLQLKITNVTLERIGLNMGGGANDYIFREFYITDVDTSIIWQSYKSNTYALATASLILEANETIILEEEWELVKNDGDKLNSGDFLLFGGLVDVDQEEVVDLQDTTVVGGEVVREFGNVGIGRSPYQFSID
ncbi:MAG: hypothetical protein ABJK11_13495 [Balneola sp.]